MVCEMNNKLKNVFYFVENFLNGKELVCLSLSDIKDLIKEIGLRNKFIQYYYALVSKFCRNGI